MYEGVYNRVFLFRFPFSLLVSWTQVQYLGPQIRALDDAYGRPTFG